MIQRHRHNQKPLIFSTISIIIAIIFDAIIIKNRNKGLGLKSNLILIITCSIMCILIAASQIIIQYDSRIPQQYETFAMIVVFASIGSFFVFIIALSVVCYNYLKKVNKR